MEAVPVYIDPAEEDTARVPKVPTSHLVRREREEAEKGEAPEVVEVWG